MDDGGRRLRVRAGWSLAASCGLLVATVPLSLSGGVMARPAVAVDIGARDGWVVVVAAAFVLSGAALIQLRPRNWIGWLLLGAGLLQTLNLAGEAYGTRALTDPDGSLPLGLAATWLASWIWLPSVLLPAIVLPALYPTGRPSGPFWTWHVRLSLLGIGLVVLTAATTQGAVDDTVRGVRLPWETPPWWGWAVGGPALVLVAATTATTIVGTVVRAVRATAPERQQLLWLVSVIAAMAGTLFLSGVAFAVSYGLLPVAVAVGVLRYRLLGIEVVLRRTLLYVPLTLLVALTVGGLTTTLARLAPAGPLPLLAASAVVAVLVIPAAGRLRVLVDRLVLGERADPLTVVDRVGVGLEIARADPVPSMLEAVAAATNASSASIVDEQGRTLASVGNGGGPTLDVPLRHNGTELGVLAVGPRLNRLRVTDQDAQLLHALAPHLAVVVSSQRLTADLARERERVTAATLAERDRLRRDLHDGLGPSLSGIALGLEAAATALRRDPDAVPDLLARTRSEAVGAVAEIRRVLDGLRPAVLDRYGLGGAVRDAAAALGMGAAGGPRFELTLDPLPQLTPAVEESAFRIVAESLTNVARHAGAEHCSVRIDLADGRLHIGVVDDGRGRGVATDGEEVRVGGHGLESMRRRAADLGGELVVVPAAPHGTRVTAVLPTVMT
jgi:signal transduction histidine kinase